jgi:hypothetical protein
MAKIESLAKIYKLKITPHYGTHRRDYRPTRSSSTHHQRNSIVVYLAPQKHPVEVVRLPRSGDRFSGMPRRIVWSFLVHLPAPGVPF